MRIAIAEMISLLTTGEPRETEMLMRGSEEGGWKRICTDTSLAAYPTCTPGSAGRMRKRALRKECNAPCPYPIRPRIAHHEKLNACWF